MHLFHFRKKKGEKRPRKAWSTGGGREETTDGSDDDGVSPQTSRESEEQQQQQPQQQAVEETGLAVPAGLNMRKSNSSPSTPREVVSMTKMFNNKDNLDAMLQQEAQESVEKQEQRKSEEMEKAHSRPTRLTFELPELPPRHPQHPIASMEKRHSLPEEILLSSVKRASRRHSFFKLFGVDSDEDGIAPDKVPVYGDHVRIINRPVVMTGRVVYMGSLRLESGNDWYGIELDQPVGSHDGVKHGQRYFQTDRNRGMFVRLKDLELLDDEN